MALGGAMAPPFSARLVDRRGARMLMPLALGYAAAVLALWALGASGAPTPLLATTAFAAGLCFPPSGAVLRSRWPSLLRHDDELVRGAYAFDSTLIELSFITGPLLVAGIVALSGPELALGLAALFEVVGVAAFIALLPGSHGPEVDEPHGGLLGALSSPAIRMIALTTLPVGFCMGTIEVAIPAFSDGQGSRELAGVFLALWSVASAAGGLAFGIRPGRRGLLETYLVIALIFPVLCLPIAAAVSPLTMGVLVLIAGLPIAPLIASRNELVARVAPAGTGAEAFTWLMTSLVAGLSIGAAVGGAVIESDGWQEAVLAGVAVSMVGAILALARRESLRPAMATT
jgi:predicted MFS family arabinose efflux permease